jgi:hypothetical protein
MKFKNIRNLIDYLYIKKMIDGEIVKSYEG